MLVFVDRKMLTDMTGFCGLRGRALRAFRTYYIIGQTRTTDQARTALTCGHQSRARAASISYLRSRGWPVAARMPCHNRPSVLTFFLEETASGIGT